jgi:hypothetical protein
VSGPSGAQPVFGNVVGQGLALLAFHKWARVTRQSVVLDILEDQRLSEQSLYDQNKLIEMERIDSDCFLLVGT